MITASRAVAIGSLTSVLVGCQLLPAPDSPSRGATPVATEPESASSAPPLALPSGMRVMGTTWWASPMGFGRVDVNRYVFECPAGVRRSPLSSPVWGTDVYTSDSSVCWAAVHAGYITVDAGGLVMIELRPGQQSYEGSRRNGVGTLSYGPWSQSFVVVEVFRSLNQPDG